jgi:phosphoglycerate dehydrogenase-like enzyme
MNGTSPHRVVVTDFLDETSVESSVLGDFARLETLRATCEADLRGRIDDAHILLVFHDIARLSDATLAQAEACVGIVRAGVGYNNIDIAAAAARGIVVCNVPDYGTEDVADHALMMLLAVARRLVDCHAAIRAGGWHFETAVGAPRMRGRTLGIVGCGRIGTAMALRAKALGLLVVYFDPYVKPGTDKALGIRQAETLVELLACSDFVSLHCYLDEHSYHLIDAAAFAAMKPGAILINTARGPVVDQTALLEALNAGTLAGAGLDVVEREPLDDDRLRQHPRVLLTPHSAFYSVEGFREMRQKAAEEARRLLTGRPPRCPVNLDLVPEARRRRMV